MFTHTNITNIWVYQDYKSHLTEKRKGVIHRRSRFSSLFQEKQLQNRKNEENEEICLNVVIKGNFNNNKKILLQVIILIG